MGDAFEGRRFKPGARLHESELWPTSDHPAVPLLLEYAGSDRSGSGHRRSQHLYFLWAYDRQTREWKELAHVSGESLEWVDTLRAVAVQHIQRSPDISFHASAGAASRILQALDSELDGLPREDRVTALGMLYEQLQARLVRDEVPEPIPCQSELFGRAAEDEVSSVA